MQVWGLAVRKNKVHLSQGSQQNVHKQTQDHENVREIITGAVLQLCLAGAGGMRMTFLRCCGEKGD